MKQFTTQIPQPGGVTPSISDDLVRYAKTAMDKSKPTTPNTVKTMPVRITPEADATNQDTTTQILAERGSRYGAFEDHAWIVQKLKAQMAAVPGWQRLAPDQREALEMVQHKIGRILNGDPNYADSWADIAGYARLVSDRLEKEQAAA